MRFRGIKNMILSSKCHSLQRDIWKRWSGPVKESFLTCVQSKTYADPSVRYKAWVTVTCSIKLKNLFFFMPCTGKVFSNNRQANSPVPRQSEFTEAKQHLAKVLERPTRYSSRVQTINVLWQSQRMIVWSAAKTKLWLISRSHFLSASKEAEIATKRILDPIL